MDAKKYEELLLLCLPEPRRNDSVRSQYEKIPVCPKCYSIYELINKESQQLSKVGIANYINSFAAKDEILMNSLAKYYKAGGSNKKNHEAAEEKGTGQSPLFAIKKQDIKEVSIKTQRILPHYMQSQERKVAAKKIESVEFPAKERKLSRSNSKGSLDQQASVDKIEFPSTQKLNLPNERIVFREVAAQVRDTKLHMGLPASSGQPEEVLPPPEDFQTEFLKMQKDQNAINLFDQPTIRKIEKRMTSTGVFSDIEKIRVVQSKKIKNEEEEMAGTVRNNPLAKYLQSPQNDKMPQKRRSDYISLNDLGVGPTSYFYNKSIKKCKNIPVYRLSTPKIPLEQDKSTKKYSSTMR